MAKEKIEKENTMNDRIHITTPRTRFIALLLLLIFIGSLVTLIFLKIPVKQKYTGFVYVDYKQEFNWEDPMQGFDEQYVYCVLSAEEYTLKDVQDISKEVTILFENKSNEKGEIVSISEMPMSENDLKEVFINDWVRNECVKDDYNWLITIKTDKDLTDDVFSLVEVTFLKEEVSLVSYLVGNK